VKHHPVTAKRFSFKMRASRKRAQTERAIGLLSGLAVTPRPITAEGGKKKAAISPLLTAFVSEGDGTRTRNHRIDRRIRNPTEKARKPRNSRHFIEVPAKLQPFASVFLHLRITAEIPRPARGGLGAVRKIPRDSAGPKRGVLFGEGTRKDPWSLWLARRVEGFSLVPIGQKLKEGQCWDSWHIRPCE
jgi:hypothetical protein